MPLDFLPDSRLRSPKGTKMVEWPLPCKRAPDGTLVDGGTVRIEVEMAYCFMCGIPYAWVPLENTVSVHALCNDCYQTHGAVPPGVYVATDEQFRQDVGHEIETRYGRTLTDVELYNEIRDHNLGPALEALLRDSVFPSLDNRPKR